MAAAAAARRLSREAEKTCPRPWGQGAAGLRKRSVALKQPGAERLPAKVGLPLIFFRATTSSLFSKCDEWELPADGCVLIRQGKKSFWAVRAFPGDLSKAMREKDRSVGSFIFFTPHHG